MKGYGSNVETNERKRCKEKRAHNMKLGAYFLKRTTKGLGAPIMQSLTIHVQEQITLNTIPSLGVHNTEGNQHLLTYTQELPTLENGLTFTNFN